MMKQMIKKITNHLRRYVLEKTAAIAILFAVMAPVLIGAAGMTIDYSQAYLVEQRLSQAIDAAALAAASSSDDPDVIEQKVRQFFDANYPPEKMGFTLDPQVTIDGDVVKVIASARYDTIFMPVFGVDEVDVSASTEISRAVRPVEIVFGFDTTGSMGFGNRWDDAMDAVEGLLNSLQGAVGNEYFSAGLVPFGDRVNVGKAQSSWVNMDLVKNPLYPGQNHERTKFNGCVEPREENIDGNPWRLTDASPDEIAFVPSTEGNMDFLINRGNKYPRCKNQGNMAIVYPTRDIDAIIDRLDSMSPYGTGRLDVGLAWVYRLLSERWQGFFPDYDGPTEFDNPYVQKVAVFVTDGNTRAYDFEVNSEVEYNGASSNPDPDNYGGNNGSAAGFENLAHICNQMKDNGIDVHMIYLEGNPHSAQTMETCASAEETFYTVGDEDIEAFEQALSRIKNRIMQIHVSK